MTALPWIAQLAVVTAVAAPAPGSTAALYAQIQQGEGHYHEGELGAKYLMIEQQLKCDCGCGLDVHSCQFQMQCGTSPVWSARVRRELEQGMDEQAIKAGFVADFGQTVLMAPPAEGFNLVGYLLPAFAIVTAGMLVGLVIRGGAARRGAPVVAGHVSAEDEEKLARELARLEEAESPDW
ncbi:MAG TPA: cytochrome c-type biogenesis protein CcmH [Longimicrobiales bacterium]|nr:cytochrome c-type biogenesis protein CcmH [Longimicrobiales bacterium]